MVFYRKYRPQTIDDLDSREIRDKLHSVLSSKSLYHAFLFTGPKGLGKTSTARIVAKIVNCEKLAKDKKAKEHLKPCNKCYQCVSIGSGTNLDVLEIDGASNRGIDEIRDLKEKIRLSPSKAARKIYIIDEVHMLTQEAFNALLKTLEEPPSHVIFILCTTEPHKVPQTISSRCFNIAFRKANSDELIRSFRRIAKGEKIKIDDDGLSLIASLSDGSFRDGAKILEELALAFKSRKITRKLIEENLKIFNIGNKISQMLEFLAGKDTKKAIGLTSGLVASGLDIKYFIEQLINNLHLVLLANLGIGQKVEGEKDMIGLTTGEIKKLVELLGKAHAEIKYAILPQLPLEMAIIEWEMEDEKAKIKNQVSNITKDSDSRSPSLKPDGSDIWKKLINRVNTTSRSVAGVLRGCKLKSFDGKKITIETKFKFHKDRLDDPKVKEILAKSLEDVGGGDINIEIADMVN